jgi:hypothetical protein
MGKIVVRSLVAVVSAGAAAVLLSGVSFGIGGSNGKVSSGTGSACPPPIAFEFYRCTTPGSPYYGIVQN